MGAEPAVAALGRYAIVRRLEGHNRELYVARPKGDARPRPVVLALFEIRAEDAWFLVEEIGCC